jgi:hypothetical protein
MSTSNDLAKELSTAVLFGSTRSRLLEHNSDGALGETLALISRADQEQSLLDRLAVVTLYQNAGWMPMTTTEPLSRSSATETLRECSAGARSVLEPLIASSNERLISETLDLLADAKQRISPVLIPALLDVAISQKTIRPKLIRTVGKCGVWLARQNGRWNFVTDLAADMELECGDKSFDNWATLGQAERLQRLGRIRASRPAHARELVESTWIEESAINREAMLLALADGLSLVDEPFLESALDDRGAAVTRTAAELLARLPKSRLVRNAVQYASSLLSIQKNALGQKQLTVTLPEHYDETWRRDGIEEKPAIKDLGEKAWYLSQWISLVPPEHWSELFQESPRGILQLASKTEWFHAIILGLSKASNRSSNVNWRYEIVKYWATAKEPQLSLTRYLPTINSLDTRAETLIIETMSYHPEPLYDSHPALPLVRNYSKPWSALLSRIVFSSIRRRSMLPDDKEKSVWAVQPFFKETAYLMQPALLNEFSELWISAPILPTTWKRYVDDFFTILNIRNNLYREIAP